MAAQVRIVVAEEQVAIPVAQAVGTAGVALLIYIVLTVVSAVKQSVSAAVLKAVSEHVAHPVKHLIHLTAAVSLYQPVD